MGGDIEMNAMAIALVSAMGVAVMVAAVLMTWGLVLEARSNCEWRRRGLDRTSQAPRIRPQP